MSDISLHIPAGGTPAQQKHLRLQDGGQKPVQNLSAYGLARKFPAPRGKFLQEYWMYFKKINEVGWKIFRQDVRGEILNRL